jgi:hypothetical protein
MLGVLAEGMKKVVKGIGIILMDILSEVDPEVFGSLDKSKNVNEKQNLILEASSNKKRPIESGNKLPRDVKRYNDDFLDGLWGIPSGGGLYWLFLYDDNND